MTYTSKKFESESAEPASFFLTLSPYPMRTTGIGERPMRFLKLKEVIEKTALSRSAIYRKMDEGDFPVSVSLGDRAVAWLEEEIHSWMELRLSQRQNH